MKFGNTSGLEMAIFDPKEMLGTLDLWSMGYCKIQQGILQQNLSKYHRFKSVDALCEHFNRFINTVKKERKKKQKKNSHGWIQALKENICQIGRY